MVQTQPKYVYGVLGESSDPPAVDGIAGAQLELISSDGVAALVSDLREDQLQLGREQLATHSRVLEEALSGGTVLPMRFGVVMEDDGAVRRDLLDAHHEELATHLEELAGKVELKLRATYEEDTLMHEVVSEDRDIARMRDSLRDQPEDATYYARIRLGELVAAAIERKRDADADQILQVLAPLALAVDLGGLPNERIVLSASFLVERGRLERFDAAVDQVGRAQAGRMRMKYTGPLPPYSFVELATEA